MHVTGPHMRGKQVPASVRANLPERFQYDRSALAVELIRRLIHYAPFRFGAPWIGLQPSGSKPIVMTVYRTRFVTVKMCAVAGKSEEIPHSFFHPVTEPRA